MDYEGFCSGAQSVPRSSTPVSSDEGQRGEIISGSPTDDFERRCLAAGICVTKPPTGQNQRTMAARGRGRGRSTQPKPQESLEQNSQARSELVQESAEHPGRFLDAPELTEVSRGLAGVALDAKIKTGLEFISNQDSRSRSEPVPVSSEQPGGSSNAAGLAAKVTQGMAGKARYTMKYKTGPAARDDSKQVNSINGYPGDLSNWCLSNYLAHKNTTRGTVLPNSLKARDKNVPGSCYNRALPQRARGNSAAAVQECSAWLDGNEALNGNNIGSIGQPLKTLDEAPGDGCLDGGSVSLGELMVRAYPALYRRDKSFCGGTSDGGVRPDDEYLNGGLNTLGALMRYKDKLCAAKLASDQELNPDTASGTSHVQPAPSAWPDDVAGVNLAGIRAKFRKYRETVGPHDVDTAKTSIAYGRSTFGRIRDKRLNFRRRHPRNRTDDGTADDEPPLLDLSSDGSSGLSF